ncbi:Short chain aldehyde dehydrogenase 1-like protein [Drosera capensis]
MNNLLASATSATTKRLESKVAVITGGVSGIGAYTVKLFLQHGAKDIIADIQDDAGLSLCKNIGSEDISYVHCDVSRDADVKHLVDTAMSKYGNLDIMYSNAGYPGKFNVKNITDSEGDDFKRVLDVNLYGGFSCAKYAAEVMIPKKQGVILFTSSIVSKISTLGSHAYTVSKFALVGLARNLCVDLGRYGIRENSISPTTVATPMVLQALNMDRTKIEELYESSTVLKGVIIKEEDVANTALFLASDEAKAITGQNVPVDGGYSTTNLAFITKVKELISSLR